VDRLKGAAGNSRLKCGRVNTLKTLNNYPLITMSRSLYSGANKAYFKSYLV